MSAILHLVAKEQPFKRWDGANSMCSGKIYTRGLLNLIVNL